MSSRWALTEQFSITDQTGAPAFEVHGNFGLVKQLSFRDQSGREVALLKKHLMTNKYEITVGGRPAADVHHTGIFGEHYDIDSSQGKISAKGNFAGWHYTLSRGGTVIASVARELALKEKFTVDIADGEDDVYILAAVLAIDNIHDERREQDHNSMGGMPGLGGGLLGGGLPGLGGGLPGIGGNFP
jgi:uncharacterized protein YxjI